MKRALTVLFLGPLCLLLASCVVITPDRIVNSDENNYYNANVMVFTYGGYRDADGDSLMSFAEFTEFNKQIFHDGDFIGFGLSLRHKPIGTPCSMKLFPPGYASPAETVDFKTEYLNNVRYQSYSVSTELLPKYGAGEYRAEWRVNDSFVGSSIIAIIPPAQTSRPATLPAK